MLISTINTSTRLEFISINLNLNSVVNCVNSGVHSIEVAVQV